MSTFIESARRRNEALKALHGPLARTDECLCGRKRQKCGTWTDMQTIAALLDVAEAAQAWGRFACDKIPEKVVLSAEEWAAAECGECPSCRLNVALQKLPQICPEEGQ